MSAQHSWTEQINPFAESEDGDWGAWPRHDGETEEKARERIIGWGYYVLGSDPSYADDRVLYERGEIKAGWVVTGVEGPWGDEWVKEAKETDDGAQPAWIVRPS